MNKKSAIVVGAGIVGLAMSRALAQRNYRVQIIERTTKAIGASVRNFGMVWPIGQPDGELYERALLSKSIWKETCQAAGIWYEEKGALHLAYHQDEMNVLEDLQAIYHNRKYEVLGPEAVLNLSPFVNAGGLLGALYSKEEMVVNPKLAIDEVAAFLEERFNVEIIRGKSVTGINYPRVHAGQNVYEADEIYVCSGSDFETLYPDLFSELPLTKCKLQMIRLEAQPNAARIGPSLCGGLSLLHYKSFRASSLLGQLERRLNEEYPDYKKWGIHVMASQNDAGEITIGDSHEYGDVHDPFDRNFINDLILDYLHHFARFRNAMILETWNGVYAKITDGRSHFIANPEPGVTIINGLGGAGMTLSFGLCDQLAAGSLNEVSSGSTLPVS